MPRVASRVFDVMGTVATIDVCDDVDEVVAERAIDACRDELDRLESMFSTYRPSSEVSLINRGALDVASASSEVRDVLAACAWLERDSGGVFCVHPPDRPDTIDPSGYVKGWAAERAAMSLSNAGLRNWCLNVGGDLVACGSPDAGRPWRAAVRDPADPLGVALVIAVADAAVATSATYERGAHLWNARGRCAHPVASLTVVGPKLAWADAFATAAFVMGREGLSWVGAHDGYEAFAIDDDGAWWASKGFEKFIVQL